MLLFVLIHRREVYEERTYLFVKGGKYKVHNSRKRIESMSVMLI